MPAQTQPYVPILDTGLSVIPEVSLPGKSLFEVQLYAQDHGLEVLSSPDINKVARIVRPEKPYNKFIRHARERTDLTDKDVADAYVQLRSHTLETYFVRAKEILVWTSQTHRRIKSFGSPDPGASMLIRDYRIDHNNRMVGNDATSKRLDYVIDITGIEPDPRVRVDWLKENGIITPEAAKLLGAQQDIRVWTRPEHWYWEGLRVLDWNFMGRAGLNNGRPELDSIRSPWDTDSIRGYLLGKKL